MCVRNSLKKVLFFKYVENSIIFYSQGFSNVPNSIPALKRGLKLYFNILEFVIFTRGGEGVGGAISSPLWVVHLDELNAVSCNPTWLSPDKRLQAGYSDSLSSLYSFCVHGVLVFWVFLRLQSGLSISLAFQSCWGHYSLVGRARDSC